MNEESIFFPNALVVFDNLDELILTDNNVIIELSAVNPLFDIELIKGQLDFLKINPDCVIKSTGHIPGSEPERVYYFNSSGEKVQYFNSNKQKKSINKIVNVLNTNPMPKELKKEFYNI